MKLKPNQMMFKAKWSRSAGNLDLELISLRNIVFQTNESEIKWAFIDNFSINCQLGVVSFSMSCLKVSIFLSSMAYRCELYCCWHLKPVVKSNTKPHAFSWIIFSYLLSGRYRGECLEETHNTFPFQSYFGARINGNRRTVAHSSVHLRC